jgi:hypothetical protein
MTDSVRDAEKWLIDVCTTEHVMNHNCLLADCKNSICIALAALADKLPHEKRA